MTNKLKKIERKVKECVCPLHGEYGHVCGECVYDDPPQKKRVKIEKFSPYWKISPVDGQNILPIDSQIDLIVEKQGEIIDHINSHE